MDGSNVLGQAAMHPQQQGLPVVMVMASSGVQDVVQVVMDHAPMPICLASLLHCLHRYLCRVDVACLVQGVTHGFRITYEGQRVHVMPENVCSIKGMGGMVR